MRHIGSTKDKTERNQGGSIQKYQQQIVEEIKKIQNAWMLQQIWLMIQNIQK